MHTVVGPDGLNNPHFVLAAPDGSVYIADTGNNRISQLTTSGAVNVIAGTGHPGYSGDNGAAIGAELNGPTGMALDSKGNLYFVDTVNRAVRRIDTSGVITTVTTGDSQYQLSGPQALAVGSDGTLFIADPGWDTIWRVAPDGTFSNFAVTEVSAYSLTLLPDGSLLFAQGDLLLLSPDGSTVSTYARAINPASVTVGTSGIYYTSTGSVVYRAASTTNEPALFAGQYYTGDAPDNSSAVGPVFSSLSGMIVGPDGSIWVADSGASKIRKILPGGSLRVIASGIAATALALDSAGNLYAGGSASVWKITPGGTPQLFAGGGAELIPALGAPAMAATSVNLSALTGIVTDSGGNLYALSVTPNTSDSLITRITPTGQLTTIWDSTTMPGEPRDYGAIGGLAMDAQGYLIVPVNLNRQILRIATDGSGVFQTLTTPDPVASIATSPSGEIFYFTTAGRIEALHSGATLYNRDADPSGVEYLAGPGYLLEGNFTPAYLVGNFISFSLLSTPIEVERPASLATDASGNVYATDATQSVIRRFPVGSCFTVSPPHISNDSLPAPITPPPSNAYSTTSSGPVPSTFAPGELMSIFGTGLGPKTGVKAQADSNGLIAKQLAGTQVLFEGVPAPVLYVSDGRVDTIVPFTMYGYSHVVVQVEYNGVLSDAVALSTSPSEPVVFTSSASGQPVALVANQDGSINSPSNPAAPGSIITFYGTGFGLTTPAGIDGHLATAPLPTPVLPVAVTVDGLLAQVIYAGDASGMVEGIVQINVRLPKYASEGGVQVMVGNNWMGFGISIAGN